MIVPQTRSYYSANSHKILMFLVLTLCLRLDNGGSATKTVGRSTKVTRLGE
jgi:hypothetical protein